VPKHGIRKKRRDGLDTTVAMQRVENRRVEFNEAASKPRRSDIINSKPIRKKRRVKHNLADVPYKGVVITIPEYEFCLKYLSMKKPNAATAAELCGMPRGAGYNVMRKIMVKRCIRYMQQERSLRTNVRADQVVVELGYIALSDPRDCFDVNGNLLPVKDLPEGAARSISSIKTDEIIIGRGRSRKVIGHTREIKFWPKPKALDKLTQHVDVASLFPHRMELTGKDGKDLQGAVIYLPDNGRGDGDRNDEVGGEETDG